MPGIFPPRGVRDDRRWRSVSDDEKRYALFCIEFCSAVLERRPDHREALEAAANHFTALGYYTDGLSLDERLVRLHPSDPGALYNIACSFALVGRPEEALSALSRAVGHGYANHAHMSKDADLASLHADLRFHAILQVLRSRAEQS